MAQETILQHWIFTQFILPFLLIFAIVFAILEKSKILGEDKKQVNAIVAFVIGVIFVGAIFPKQFVENLILFLTIALVVLFVFLLLYGFVVSDKEKGLVVEGWMKWSAVVLITVAVIIAVIWAAGVDSELYDFLFNSSWSNTIWTNVAFIAVLVGVVIFVLKYKGE